jgi:hypothetical protein
MPLSNYFSGVRSLNLNNEDRQGGRQHLSEAEASKAIRLMERDLTVEDTMVLGNTHKASGPIYNVFTEILDSLTP